MPPTRDFDVRQDYQDSTTSSPRPFVGTPDIPLSNGVLTRVLTTPNQQVPVVVQRQLSAVVNREPVPTATADPDVAQHAVDEVYTALDGWNDEDRAINALTGHEAPLRELIKQRFLATHGTALDAYLRDQLDGRDLVRATALLHSSHTHDPHTQMALTMYGLGTRDAELFRILEGLPLTGRQELQRRYDEVFGPIGSGSLQKDFEDDLSGWELEKATAMLHRDLTEADHLYFDSVAILGTHTDSVIALIQGAWAGGIARMNALDADWKRYVNNEAHWTSDTWTSMSLYEAMDDELSGESWELVKAVLTQYQRLGGAQAGQADPATIEDARLAAARATLDAATTGGYTGLGTNEDQVFHAVTDIRTVWLERLQRVADTPEEAGYRAQWEAERARIMAFIPSEMDQDSADYKRVRLLMSGALTPADEIYLAHEELDDDKVVDLVTRTWAAQQMNQLLAQANTERCDDGGQVIRPRFDLSFAVPVTSGMPWRRIAALIREGAEDTERGAARLKLELDDDDSDGALRLGYNLLKDASGSLRDGTVRDFADAHLGEVAGSSPTNKFLAYISQRYENSYTCYDFQDLLDPARSAQTRLERAQGRFAASHTGIFDSFLSGITSIYGAVTGEESDVVTLESLDRLRFLAQHEGANDDELDAMAAMYGVPKEQLSTLEYDAFKTRLDDLRSLRQAIVDAMATAVELVVSVAITAATGGAAGGLLLASLGSALAGMALREGLQGQDYEFTSDANAQRLLVEIMAGSMGAFGGVLAEGIGEAAEVAQLGRTQFMRGALQEGFQGVGRTIGEGAFSNRMPTPEDIAARALSIAGASVGAGAGRVLQRGAAGLPTVAGQLRRNVGAAMTNQMIAGMSDEAASVVRTGVGDMTGPEMAGRFARRGVQAMMSGLVSGAGDTLSQRRSRSGEDDIQDLPDASTIRGGDRPFTTEEADQVYQNCRRDTPHREAAILENTTTGERVVVQGDESRGFGDQLAFAQTSAELAGTWRLVKHSHPTDASGVTPVAARLPSGRGGDFTVAFDEAAQTGRPVEHTIDITTERGAEQVRYGYDPTTPDRPFWIDRPDGSGGRQRVSFRSFEAYHEWYENQFGHSPEIESHGPASPDATKRTWRDVEREATAESTEYWRGRQTETEFVRHQQNFRSLAATLRNTMLALQGKGRGSLLPVVNEEVLRTPIDQFIRDRSVLATEMAQLRQRAAGNPVLRDEINNFIDGGSGHGGRDIASRTPDIVEFFLDRGEIVITDITQDPLSPVHQFKTQFYVEVFRAMLGGQGPQVYALDINPSRGPVPISQEFPPGK